MLDWDDLRFFLATARLRTLAAAAKQLHVTQSTVSRRLAGLQASLGVRLLHRSGSGYVLTLAGESIRAHVERVELETLAVERAVGGHDVKLEGIVRVGSAQLLTSHLLAASFAALHLQHHTILIEALSGTEAEMLATREADIVVRFRRFEEHDLVVRNVGHLAFGLYGSLAYLARHGGPEPGSGCAGHQLIELFDNREVPPHAGWIGEHAGRANVVLRADSYETQYWSAYNGGGLALLPCFRADREPALRRIALPAPVPAAEIWLGVRREDRHVPRIRIVLDLIAAAVRDNAALLEAATSEVA